MTMPWLIKRETAIETNVATYALERYRVASIKVNVMGNAGYPDRIFLFPKHAAWLEFKRAGEEPSKLQYARIAELEALGYVVGWVDNEADGRAFIDGCASDAILLWKDRHGKQ